MTFFQFESDFVDSLHCIPMQVRYKLDTCGVKLKLEHWNKFTSEERETFVNMPCETPAEIEAYRESLQALVSRYMGAPAKTLEIDPNPPWTQKDSIPDDVQTQAHQFDIEIGTAQWAGLSNLERFALYKLSRPSHENRNFLPALQEFQLKTPLGGS